MSPAGVIMRRQPRIRARWLLPSAILLLLGPAPGTHSLRAKPAQDQQQPQPGGPATEPGETVVVPKKTPPAATTQPQEKKPEKINPKEVYTLSTTTNLVSVNVLVTDNVGNPIPTLTKDNFHVYDDGVQQSLSNFGTSEAPLTVCLLVQFADKYWSFLYLALEDAYGFINAMKPQDWVAVVEFDMRTHILTDFTQDRSTVSAALDTLRIPGFQEANLYDALAFTIDRMKDIQGRKAIIAICTGSDDLSKITYSDMLKIAKASETPIYPISILEFMDVRNPFGGGIGPEALKAQLSYMAQYSGGQAYFPRFEADLPAVYQQIAGQLRTEYSLGFSPSNSAHDGKYHKLKVELVDGDGSPLRIINQKGKQVKYKILARDGYYAPRS
jgi:Ca-activated chloride channel family protein